MVSRWKRPATVRDRHNSASPPAEASLAFLLSVRPDEVETFCLGSLAIWRAVPRSDGDTAPVTGGLDALVEGTAAGNLWARWSGSQTGGRCVVSASAS